MNIHIKSILSALTLLNCCSTYAMEDSRFKNFYLQYNNIIIFNTHNRDQAIRTLQTYIDTFGTTAKLNEIQTRLALSQSLNTLIRSQPQKNLIKHVF